MDVQLSLYNVLKYCIVWLLLRSCFYVRWPVGPSADILLSHHLVCMWVCRQRKRTKGQRTLHDHWRVARESTRERLRLIYVCISWRFFLIYPVKRSSFKPFITRSPAWDFVLWTTVLCSISAQLLGISNTKLKTVTAIYMSISCWQDTIALIALLIWYHSWLI